MSKKISRNAPCPCGSGKKFKNCCLEKMANKQISAGRLRTIVNDIIASIVPSDMMKNTISTAKGTIQSDEQLMQERIALKDEVCQALGKMAELENCQSSESTALLKSLCPKVRLFVIERIIAFDVWLKDNPSRMLKKSIGFSGFIHDYYIDWYNEHYLGDNREEEDLEPFYDAILPSLPKDRTTFFYGSAVIDADAVTKEIFEGGLYTNIFPSLAIPGNSLFVETRAPGFWAADWDYMENSPFTRWGAMFRSVEIPNQEILASDKSISDYFTKLMQDSVASIRPIMSKLAMAERSIPINPGIYALLSRAEGLALSEKLSSIMLSNFMISNQFYRDLLLKMANASLEPRYLIFARLYAEKGPGFDHYGTYMILLDDSHAPINCPLFFPGQLQNDLIDGEPDQERAYEVVNSIGAALMLPLLQAISRLDDDTREKITQDRARRLAERSVAPMGVCFQSPEELDISRPLQPQIDAYITGMQHRWLDTPIPALNNKTPREAARTAAGRRELEALFEYIRQRPSAVPFPFDKFRKELGMDKLLH